MITLKQLCSRLKDLREENGLLQSEIAVSTSIPQPTISNIERGNNFNIEHFIALYNYYCEKKDSNQVVSKLFNLKDAYAGALAEKLKTLSQKHSKEIENIINTLE